MTRDTLPVNNMSDAPFASTSTVNGLEPRRSMSNVNNRRPGTGAGTRRKGKGRGRQMMREFSYRLFCSLAKPELTPERG